MKQPLLCSVLAFGVAMLVGACGSSEGRDGFDNGQDPTLPPSENPGGQGSIVNGTPTPPKPPGQGCEKMDIVFVVDNSGSMGEEQANLAANFPKFVSVLDGKTASNGAPLDYRVSITTTGKSYTLLGPFNIPDNVKGDDGAFRNNCGGSQRWLDRSQSSSFACRAQVGTGGPSEEMPLECMKLSLDDRVKDGTNAGFLRDDALLAVVFLTDEDDCSFTGKDLKEGFGDLCEDGAGAATPASYVAFLDKLKGDRSRWATAVIAGKTSCTSTFGSAAEAKRLAQFVTATGKNAVFSSICDGDLSISLKNAIDKFGEACQSFSGPR